MKANLTTTFDGEWYRATIQLLEEGNYMRSHFMGLSKVSKEQAVKEAKDSYYSHIKDVESEKTEEITL